MGKRSHDKLTSADDSRVHAPRDQKRARFDDEDVEHSVDAFISFIANPKALDVGIDLKNRPLKLQDLPSSTKRDLKSLSRSLLHFLPAITALAEEEGPEPQLPSSTESSSAKQERQPQASSYEESTGKAKTPSRPPVDPSLGAIPLPSLDTLTKWTVDDISTSLPPLPAVLDPVIETASFTHPGMAWRPTDLNYERLEWIGDSYLYVISSGLIYATFPTLPPGKCAHIRETLVRNSTLSSYSLRYGFDRRANFPAEFGLGGRPGGTKATEKERTKVLGDIFEAYVAAVVLSDRAAGFARVTAWLKALWAGTVADEIRQAAELRKRAAELPPKNQLANLIVIRGVRLRYEDAPVKGGGGGGSAGGSGKKGGKDARQPAYTVNVFLDGWGETNKLLGWGTAPNKSEAGHKAALCAMENKKMIEVYAARKRAHVAAVEAQKKEEQ